MGLLKPLFVHVWLLDHCWFRKIFFGRIGPSRNMIQKSNAPVKSSNLYKITHRQHHATNISQVFSWNEIFTFQIHHPGRVHDAPLITQFQQRVENPQQ